jgi:hypothetical protein
MKNKVVLHFIGGEIKKGTTEDFFPNKDIFHFTNSDGGEQSKISLQNLKAIFFVKSFDGNRNYQERDDVERTGFGKKIEVIFKDGELQRGYTQGYAPNRPGFFIFPSDPDSNNERVFVVNAATSDVRFL